MALFAIHHHNAVAFAIPLGKWRYRKPAGIMQRRVAQTFVCAPPAGAASKFGWPALLADN
jgi:hypothetical protein